MSLSVRAQQPAKHYELVTKAAALKALRIMFGPTARIAAVKRAGVAGVRVYAGGSVMHTTFNLAGDVWLRVVAACHPYWTHTKEAVQ